VFSTESRAQGTDLRRRCGFAGRGLVVAVVLVLAVAFEVPLVLAETAATEPLAEVNGETITTAELERALGAKLSRLQEQIYDLKRQELEGLIAQRLLTHEAAKRGISVAALLDAEVTAKVGLVTESEIEAFYQANKGRLRGDESRLRDGIRAHLQEQKLAARRNQLLESLRSQSKSWCDCSLPYRSRGRAGRRRVSAWRRRGTRHAGGVLRLPLPVLQARRRL
jgi:SurA N-terminal domain